MAQWSFQVCLWQYWQAVQLPIVVSAFFLRQDLRLDLAYAVGICLSVSCSDLIP